MNSGEKIYSIEVILGNLESNPICAHGPTLLFSRKIDNNGTKKLFYACSAYRDRKGCPFFMWADEFKQEKIKTSAHQLEEYNKIVPKIDHEEYYKKLMNIRETAPSHRSYCHTCDKLLIKPELKDHPNHIITHNIANEILNKPMSLLAPLNKNKKEAQYLFSQESVEVIANITLSLDYRNILCIGTPLIHEYIQGLRKQNSQLSSLLFDIDSRFHSFYGPTEFCWYNSFNHYFFNDQGEKTFNEFLQIDGGRRTCVIMDPPFGGRLEPLSQTIKIISSKLQMLNQMEIKQKENNIPVMLIMPYFMEPMIKSCMPDMFMCDYKVTYRNHTQFRKKESAQGSIVRIFTNIPLRKIKLPLDDYKFCEICDRWVSLQNAHCSFCNTCTSKDGRTYIHCHICKRCVKSTWSHCKTCSKCCLPAHNCTEKQLEENHETPGRAIRMSNNFKNLNRKDISKQKIKQRLKKKQQRRKTNK